MDTDLMFSSKSNVWETPQFLFDRLNKEFNFTLDPCADVNTFKCSKYYTEADNGLAHSWAGETCFVNPPYSRNLQKHWIKKSYDEWRDNNVTTVMLLPARPETIPWFDYVSKAAQIRFLKGRLKFSGHANSAPFPSAIVIYSNIIYPEQVIFVDYRI